MPRVNVMYDIAPEYLFDETNNGHEIKINKDKGKYVRISDKIFDLMLSEGRIKKTDDGYIFVGKHEKDLKPKKKKH